MSNSFYRVYRNGEYTDGLALHHNASDTWNHSIFHDSTARDQWKRMSTQPACWCGKPPVWVALVDYHDAKYGVFTMRACLWCKTLVLPGFDGYDYSEYDDAADDAVIIARERQAQLARKVWTRP